MTIVRTSPSGPNITVGGGGGAVNSVFGRSGDVVAQTDDYSSAQIDNVSSVTGDTVSEALETLATDIGTINTDEVFNFSPVPGDTASDALGFLLSTVNNLTSDQVSNVSTLPGATVTEALDAVFILTTGRLLGSASRLTAGAQVIACPAGTRRVLVSMVAGGGSGAGGLQTAVPSQTNSAGGAGGSGAEQEFIYTSGSDIASVSVDCGVGAAGQLNTGGTGGDTTVTINGDVFTSKGGEGGSRGNVTSAPISTGAMGGLPGRFNFQSGVSFVLLRSNGGQPGGNSTPFSSSGSFWLGGLGGSSTFGGGGRGGLSSAGEAATGNGSGGGGGSSSAGVTPTGGASTPGAVSLMFFS